MRVVTAAGGSSFAKHKHRWLWVPDRARHRAARSLSSGARSRDPFAPTRWLTCPGRRGSYSLRLEKAVARVAGGALLGHGGLQPLDFRTHQRDALGEFLDRKQRPRLPDLVGDAFPRLVLVLDGHASFPVLSDQ